MVLRYAPELSKRCRRELKPTNGSWSVDKTYIRVKGKWTYLYRAVDSAGATIDFLPPGVMLLPPSASSGTHRVLLVTLAPG